MGAADNNNRAELEAYEQIVKNLNLKPKTLFEIGSKDGADAKRLATFFEIDPSNVYIIEAHPIFFQNIKYSYPEYNCFHFAASDKNEELIFNAALNYDDGRSSILERDIYDSNSFSKVSVSGVRLDSFLDVNNIEEVDLLKIDVEGAGMQVLTGFGDALTKVKTLQIEAEYKNIWKGSSTWSEIRDFLFKDFNLYWKKNISGIQIDSIWVNKRIV